MTTVAGYDSTERYLITIERWLTLGSVALGFLHTWAGRYSINPDGISYLDVGSAFFRHDASAFNAYWSPLYPWILGTVVGIVNPTSRWELPVVHLVNLGIFIGALTAFRFFLHSLLLYRRQGALPGSGDEMNPPDWVLALVGYAIFLWSSFELTLLYAVSPDLTVSACVYLAFGLLLRARLFPSKSTFALLGLVLGIGYCVKAPMFPLSFVFLTAAYLWNRQSPVWSRGLVLTLTTFLVTAVPLVAILSMQKSRLTFGDSARLNYAWAVGPRTFWRNWQGEERGSGTPTHPTRRLLSVPSVFEFAAPVGGTYPPWFDPSYWNEGLHSQFSLKPQGEVLFANFISEARLLFRSQPGLLTGLIAMGFLGGAVWLAKIRRLWPLLAVPLCALAMYAPVHFEDRFVGGFIVVLFLTLIAGCGLPTTNNRVATYVLLAASITTALGICDVALRFATHHLANPGSGPNSAIADVTAAEQIRKLGLTPGDEVSVIGDGTKAYWARLAKLRIVAEIMAANHDAREFWQSSEETKRLVYRTLARTGARAVVADNPPESETAGWVHLSDTNYYVRWLEVESGH